MAPLKRKEGSLCIFVRVRMRMPHTHTHTHTTTGGGESGGVRVRLNQREDMNNELMNLMVTGGR